MAHDTNGNIVDYRQILEDYANPYLGMHQSPISKRLAEQRAREERLSEYKESLLDYRFDNLAIECDQRDDYRSALLDMFKGNFSAAIRVKKIMDQVAEQMIEDHMNG